MKNTKEVNYAINKLNDLQYKVLQIEGSFYAALHFNEAKDGDWKHDFKGRNIDDVIVSFIQINTNDIVQAQSLHQKIEALPVLNKWFHKDCKFIYHLPQIR